MQMCVLVSVCVQMRLSTLEEPRPAGGHRAEGPVSRGRRSGRQALDRTAL